MTHELKILPQYFEAIDSGDKTFELRLNDRDYHVGDMLYLREYSASCGGYTGRTLTKKVTYVLKHCPEYGLKESYCILGFHTGGGRGGRL